MSAGIDSMDRYAVIGHPVAHSQSPFIHEAFARQTGQSLRYERLLAPLDGFEATVRAFVEAGGRGCNVTVPFKFEAARLVQQASPRVHLAQAANTLCFDDGRWTADNTDGLGLVADIEVQAGLLLRGTTVLLLGAGGASAGVLGPLIAAQPRAVVVLNRSVDKALKLAARHADWAQTHQVALRAGGLGEAMSQCAQGCEVLINGTASSLAGAEVPIDPRVLRPGSLAVDMMYGPKAAPFLTWARDHGAVARDGLGMLVEQAAAAFERWRGVRPHTPPVLQALRDRLATAGAS